jgi:hypothetical protein
MAQEATKETTREVPLLEMRGAFKPGSVNADARTVDMIFSTGARVLRGGFWSDPYYEELSLDAGCVRMGRLNNGAPLLAAHNGADLGAVLGVVKTAKLTKIDCTACGGTGKCPECNGKKCTDCGGSGECSACSGSGKMAQGIATVRFAKAEDDPEADKVFRKVQDGILQNVSVGYRVYKLEETGEMVGKVPVLRATDWEPHEVSVVPMGADDGAGFRSSDSIKNPCVFATRARGEKTMEKPVVDPAAAPAADPNAAAIASVEEATRVAAKARKESDLARAAASAEQIEEAKSQERARVSEIRRLVKRARLGDDLADRLVDSGATLDAVRAALIDQLAQEDTRTMSDGHTRFSAGEDARDKFVRGASAWLFERSGVESVIREAQVKDPKGRFKDVTLDAGEFRGLSLIELARECLERQGVKTRGMGRMELVAQAFTFRSAMQTTSDFAVLLENVLFKTVLGQYAITPDTWSLFAKADTVSDFRPSNRYRTGSISSLDSVGENGEYKNKAIPDGQKFSILTGTKGNIIGVSRQTIINDDMGALANLAAMLGRAAKLSVEVDVYALLAQNSGLGPTQADAQPFFHANRANVNGTGSAITLAGINADVAIMKAQKDISGNEFLDLNPNVLLVPYTLRGDADTINTAQYDPADNKFQKPNYCKGLFARTVGTPRLSGNRRYIFADPSVCAAIVVAFLEGQGQAPWLDSENGWRVDGVELKVRLDYKAQMFDPKGAVTNAGQ